MILQALNAYYERLTTEGGNDIPAQGFEQKEIPFLIIVSQTGEFRDLQDTRVASGKRLVGRKFTVPKEHGRSGSNAWQEANLLWDHYGYVLAWPKSENEADKRMAWKQHGSFVAKVKTLLDQYPDNSEVRAVYRFLSAGNFEGVFSSSSWADCKKIPGCNLTFRLEEVTRLVCENDDVRTYVAVANSPATDTEEDAGSPQARVEDLCLVTGEYGAITRLHPRTPLPDSKSKSNAKIVSFQKNSGFDSYGKQQSYNAPIGTKVAFAYTTALNHMLARDSRQKIQVGDATTVFWAEKKHPLENAFAQIFGYQPPNGEPEQDYKSLIALFRSPEAGARSELDPNTKFYVLGLSPNAARIAVRFWYAGTVGSVAENLWQHFDDLEMVKGPKEWHTVGLHWLLRSTALPSTEPRKWDENIAPNLAGDTMRAILTGTPYPQTLLVSVINRTRAEQSKKDSDGKSIQNVTYTRAALIKAILARDTRYYERNEKEVGMSLDISNTNPGYLLGRLFAVLERTQEESTRPHTLNTTIRDSFYGAASSTPVAVFPTLMKLKNYHIAKLENERKGQAVNLEKQFGEIIGKLTADNAFPSHLTLPDQGRFAVGYYHQRQDFFTKKDDKEAK